MTRRANILPMVPEGTPKKPVIAFTHLLRLVDIGMSWHLALPPQRGHRVDQVHGERIMRRFSSWCFVAAHRISPVLRQQISLLIKIGPWKTT